METGASADGIGVVHDTADTALSSRQREEMAFIYTFHFMITITQVVCHIFVGMQDFSV